ncbi:MAG: hypothetical protein KBD00_04065 [Candidatus Peribacteraceae bacterium]|nr:hypothetical protein [Candidatus Peribacteraceae bacterium]
MPITYNDVIAFLTILALAMGIILLYHLILIALNLRRVSKRVDTVSEELEAVVMKPLSVMDNAMEWIIGFFEGMKDEKHPHKHKKDVDFEVVDV